MTNWLVQLVHKEARRFKPNDKVRYFVNPQKGKGRGIVLTPSFRPATVLDYDSEQRRYKIRDNEEGSEVYTHPRNLMPEVVSRNSPAAPVMQTTVQPAVNNTPVI